MSKGRKRAGIAQIEGQIVLVAVACAGLAGFVAVGASLGEGIAGGAEGAIGTTAASSQSPAAISRQASAASALSRGLAAMERAAVRRSPLGPHLALSDDARWARAVEQFTSKRVAERRPFGKHIHRVHSFKLEPDTLGGIGFRNDTYPLIHEGLFEKLVEDDVLDLLVERKGRMRPSRSSADGPFSLEADELVVHTEHPFWRGDALRTQGAYDQMIERFALHLLEASGAPPESALALHELLRTVEAVRARATRRNDLEATIKSAFATAREETGAAAPVVDRLEAGLGRLDSLLGTLVQDEAEAFRHFAASRYWADGTAADWGTLAQRMDAVAEENDAFRASIGAPASSRPRRSLRIAEPAATANAQPSALEAATAFLARLEDETPR